MPLPIVRWSIPGGMGGSRVGLRGRQLRLAWDIRRGLDFPILLLHLISELFLSAFT